MVVKNSVFGTRYHVHMKDDILWMRMQFKQTFATRSTSFSQSVWKTAQIVRTALHTEVIQVYYIVTEIS